MYSTALLTHHEMRSCEHGVRPRCHVKTGTNAIFESYLHRSGRQHKCRENACSQSCQPFVRVTVKRDCVKTTCFYTSGSGQLLVLSVEPASVMCITFWGSFEKQPRGTKGMTRQVRHLCVPYTFKLPPDCIPGPLAPVSRETDARVRDILPDVKFSNSRARTSQSLEALEQNNTTIKTLKKHPNIINRPAF